MKRVIISLLLGALIVGVVGCSPGGAGSIFGGYTVTISSNIGGTVTSPGQGAFSYPRGTVVNLVAEADRGYHFVVWTGNARTIADIYAATTTITVDNYYFVTAVFKEN